MLASLVALFTVSGDLARLKPPAQRDLLRTYLEERRQSVPPPPPAPSLSLPGDVIMMGKFP